MTPGSRRALALCAATALAACSGKDGGTGVAGSIVIQPRSAALCIGDSLTFTARVLNAAGDTVPGAQVRWASSAPGAVAIDTASGVARALAFGSAGITATSGALSSADSALLDVPQDLVPEPVPDTAVLAPSDTLTLGTQLRRTAAGPVPSHTPRLAPFSSPVASLDSTGLLTARTPGLQGMSASACGFNGHGAVRVYTPPDSVSGLGYLWFSASPVLRLSLGTKVWNFALSTKQRAFQIYGGPGALGSQFAYEDTVPLSGIGSFPVDSLLSTEATSSLQCSPPRPFAVYGDNAPSSLLSMRGGKVAVTTYQARSGYAVISGRVITRMRGFVGGDVNALDVLQAIYTFSAALRDTAGACP